MKVNANRREWHVYFVKAKKKFWVQTNEKKKNKKKKRTGIKS